MNFIRLHGKEILEIVNPKANLNFEMQLGFIHFSIENYCAHWKNDNFTSLRTIITTVG